MIFNKGIESNKNKGGKNMSLITMIIIFILIIFALFIRGIFSFKKNRTKALIMTSPLVLFVLLAVGAYTWFSHATTPDSLELQVYGENSRYTLKGEWQERQDPYAYGIDLLVFFVPDNQKIVLDNQVIDEKQIPKGFLTEAIVVLKKRNNYPEGLKPQIYPIEIQKSFAIDFVAPHLNLDGVIIKYVHILTEPMGPTTYWVKDFVY